MEEISRKVKILSAITDTQHLCCNLKCCKRLIVKIKVEALISCNNEYKYIFTPIVHCFGDVRTKITLQDDFACKNNVHCRLFSKVTPSRSFCFFVLLI